MMMEIESAKYVLDLEGNLSTIRIVVNNTTKAVPLDPANRHYREIMRQVEAGTLTIADPS